MKVPTVTHLTFRKCIIFGLFLLCITALWLHQTKIRNFNRQDSAFIFRIEQQLGPTQQRVQQVCQSKQLNYQTSEKWGNTTWFYKKIKENIFINKRHRLMYCGIAKVGSSFWKRVFKVIDESNSKQLHLYDMTSMSAHVWIPISMSLRNSTRDEMDKVLATYTKFTFVRDPFSRLFSAFVDKIFVPNAVGIHLIQMLRNLNFRNTSQQQCNYIVSFAEFCNLFADAALQGKVTDAHFKPLVNCCHPCYLNFTYIGKLETFMTDTRAILSSVNVNITDVAGGVNDIDRANDLNILKNISHRVFLFFTHRESSCLSNMEFVQRLWKHFQIRGMLPKNISLPVKPRESEGYLEEEFITAAVDAYDKLVSREDRRRQRDEALLGAYASVPRKTLEKLAQLYADDCSLFDYSCNIDRFLNQSIPSFYFNNI